MPLLCDPGRRAVVCVCVGPTKLVLFGVFDGHGGKQAATFVSKHLAANLADLLPAVEPQPEPAEPVRFPHAALLPWGPKPLSRPMPTGFVLMLVSLRV